MTYPSLAAAAVVFVLAMIFVEWQDSAAGDLTTRPISHYFSTATSWLQAIAFVLLAAACWHAAYLVGVSFVALFLALVGLGLLLSMATDTWRSAAIWFGHDRRIHKTGAAIVFIAALGLMVSAADYLAATLYVGTLALMYVIDRQHPNVLEKLAAWFIVAWAFFFAL